MNALRIPFTGRLGPILGSFLATVLSVTVSAADPGPRLGWTNQLLTVDWPGLPGGPLPVWYLEAFLHPGAHGRDWRESVIPHRTRLVETAADGRELRFLTEVDPAVEVRHTVRCVDDGLLLDFQLHNRGTTTNDLQWFQPACIRVAGFTGRDQKGFVERSFVFTESGLTTLDRTGRTEEARYRGGQVFPMPGVSESDANPRPIAARRPVNGLIGCWSADGRWILATASDRTHELFEGVYVCLHSDPAVGGLGPGERKSVRQKLYLVTNDIPALLERHRRDFGTEAVKPGTGR